MSGNTIYFDVSVSIARVNLHAEPKLRNGIQQRISSDAATAHCLYPTLEVVQT
jgi:hypothetical protein